MSLADLLCPGCGAAFLISSDDLKWLCDAIEIFDHEHRMCRHPASAVDGYLRHLGVVR
jgi:hypothetical protein